MLYTRCHQVTCEKHANEFIQHVLNMLLKSIHRSRLEAKRRDPDDRMNRSFDRRTSFDNRDRDRRSPDQGTFSVYFLSIVINGIFCTL